MGRMLFVGVHQLRKKVYEIIAEVEQHRHFSSHYAAQRLNIHHSFQLSWLEIFGCHTN